MRSRPAIEANQSQAAYSKKIKVLEEHLGVQLFHRSTRRLNLTDIGEEFYEKSLQIIHKVQESRNIVQDTSTRLTGRLKISAPIVFGQLYLPEIIDEFQRRHPDIELEILLQDKFLDLIKHRIDLSIRVGHLKDSDLKVSKVCDCQRVFVASKEYLKSHNPIRTPNDLEEHFLMASSIVSTVNQFSLTHNNQEKTYQLQPSMTSNNGELVRRLLISGLGIAQAPQWMVKQDLESGELEEILTDYKGPEMPISLLFPPGKYTPKAVKIFASFVKDKLVEILG